MSSRVRLMPYQQTLFKRMKNIKLLEGVKGARTETRDFHVHESKGEDMSRKISLSYGQFQMIKKTAHDEQMWELDKDPQGMGMPFKEYITEDSDHHLTSVRGRRVHYEFPNGYGLSVISGELFYTDEDHPYEVCPLLHGKLCYDALDPTHQDVYPHQNDEDLFIMIAKLIALPPKGEEK